MVQMFTKTLARALTILGLASTLALAQGGGGGLGSTGMVDTPHDAVASEVRQDMRHSEATRPDAPMAHAWDRDNALWAESWDRVGSGGSNVGLHNGINPYIRDTQQTGGTNPPGADHGVRSR